MTNETKITDSSLPPPETMLLPRRAVGGWMAWAKQKDCGWLQLCPIGIKSNWQATPGMLFASREDALKQASETALSPTELKLFYVELEK